MTRPLIIRFRAESDLASIYEWYEAEAPGIGSRFIASVDLTFALIERFPEVAPIYHHEYRRRLIPRFPYGVFYILRPDVISVGAVFHLSRDPDWIKRDLEENR